MIHRYVPIFLMIILLITSIQALPEYVSSECYGNSFNFDCGQGHKIRITKDFYGYSRANTCVPSPDDCKVPNPNTDSLIHRYCTGKKTCPYFQVERRACNGVYTNYQQVEYQCVPETQVVDMCQVLEYSTNQVYLSSPNFPQNYPPGMDCSCFITTDQDSLILLEILYMSIKHNFPCGDWLRIGRNRMCGMMVDLFSGQQMPLEFHSDNEGGHAGFWLQLKASRPDGKLHVQCRNTTLQELVIRRVYRSRERSRQQAGRSSGRISGNEQSEVPRRQPQQSSNRGSLRNPTRGNSRAQPNTQRAQGSTPNRSNRGRSRNRVINEMMTSEVNEAPRQEQITNRRTSSVSRNNQESQATISQNQQRTEANFDSRRRSQGGQIATEQNRAQSKPGGYTYDTNFPQSNSPGIQQQRQDSDKRGVSNVGLTGNSQVGQYSSDSNIRSLNIPQNQGGNDNRDFIDQPSRQEQTISNSRGSNIVSNQGGQSNGTMTDPFRHIKEQLDDQQTSPSRAPPFNQNLNLEQPNTRINNQMQQPRMPQTGQSNNPNTELTNFRHVNKESNRRPTQSQISRSSGEISKNTVTKDLSQTIKPFYTPGEQLQPHSGSQEPRSKMVHSQLIGSDKSMQPNHKDMLPTVGRYEQDLQGFTTKQMNSKYQNDIKQDATIRGVVRNKNTPNLVTVSDIITPSPIGHATKVSTSLKNLTPAGPDTGSNIESSKESNNKSDLYEFVDYFNSENSNNDNVYTYKDFFSPLTIDSPFKVGDTSQRPENKNVINQEGENKNPDTKGNINTKNIEEDPRAVHSLPSKEKDTQVITSRNIYFKGISKDTDGLLQPTTPVPFNIKQFLKTYYGKTYSKSETEDTNMKTNNVSTNIDNKEFSMGDLLTMFTTPRKLDKNKENVETRPPKLLDQPDSKDQFADKSPKQEDEHIDDNREQLHNITDGALQEHDYIQSHETPSKIPFDRSHNVEPVDPEQKVKNENIPLNTDNDLNQQKADKSNSQEKQQQRIESDESRHNYNLFQSKQNENTNEYPNSYNQDDDVLEEYPTSVGKNLEDAIQDISSSEYEQRNFEIENPFDRDSILDIGKNIEETIIEEENQYSENYNGQGGIYNEEDTYIYEDRYKFGFPNSDKDITDDSKQKTIIDDTTADNINMDKKTSEYFDGDETGLNTSTSNSLGKSEEKRKKGNTENVESSDKLQKPNTQGTNSMEIISNEDEKQIPISEGKVNEQKDKTDNSKPSKTQDTFETDTKTGEDIIHGEHYFGDIPNLDNSETNKTDILDYISSGSSNNNTIEEADVDVKPIADSNGDGSALTIGLIILSVCVAAGLVLLSCFFLALLCHRRKRRAAVAPRPTLAIIHAKREILVKQQHDADSGRSLLIHAEKQNHQLGSAESYAKGRGHQSVVDVDSLYAKPHKRDKMIQADMSDGYEEVVISKKAVFSIETSDSDESLQNFQQPTPTLSPYNDTYIRKHKAVQAKANLFKAARGSNLQDNGVSTQKKQQDINVNSASSKLNKPYTNNINTISESSSKYGQPSVHNNYITKPNIPPKPAFLRAGGGIIGNKECDVNTDKKTIAIAGNVPNEPKNTDPDHLLKTKTIASMPGLAEMTFMPENSPVYYEITEPLSDDDSDWETKSAISL